jgi:hypothetical protein
MNASYQTGYDTSLYVCRSIRADRRDLQVLMLQSV